MKQTAADLKSIVDEYTPKMGSISDVDFSHKPNPAKWSKKELTGHLIDSAQNNLRRFIVTQYQPDIPQIVYDQDFWTKVNGYQQMKKEDVIMLWKLMNERICEVISNMPEDNHLKECNTGKGEPELHTLKWLANDYVKHLKYHMNQLLPGSFADIIY